METVDIVDIISQRVDLQEVVAYFWSYALSILKRQLPVSRPTMEEYLHCFGCGKGGNSRNFLMEYEKLVLWMYKYLATQLGININIH